MSRKKTKISGSLIAGLCSHGKSVVIWTCPAMTAFQFRWVCQRQHLDLIDTGFRATFEDFVGVKGSDSEHAGYVVILYVVIELGSVSERADVLGWPWLWTHVKVMSTHTEFWWAIAFIGGARIFSGVYFFLFFSSKKVNHLFSVVALKNTS